MRLRLRFWILIHAVGEQIKASEFKLSFYGRRVAKGWGGQTEVQ